MYLQRYSQQEFSVNLGDIKLDFGKLGINKITHPVGFVHSSAYSLNTDWISPYNAGTVTDGVPDNNHATVGGNHGTDGGGGWATANSESTSLKVDGVEVPANGRIKSFKKAELVTVNLVTNKANINLTTGQRLRNDFKETVKYTFERNHMRVEVELEALEDFYINWYLGLQITRDGWRTDAYFNRDLSMTELYAQTADQLNSGKLSESPELSRVTMRNNTGDIVHVYLDREYGIGYTKIRPTDPIMYLSSGYLKMYYHLVKNGNQLIVPKGTKVSYRGGYIFGKNKAVNATSVTYFVEDGVEKAFVDFKVLATESINYTSVEDSFNCEFEPNKIISIEPNAYAKVVI